MRIMLYCQAEAVLQPGTRNMEACHAAQGKARTIEPTNAPNRVLQVDHDENTRPIFANSLADA